MTIERTAFLILAGTIAVLLGVAIFSGGKQKEKAGNSGSSVEEGASRPEPVRGSDTLDPGSSPTRGKRVELDFSDARKGSYRTKNEPRKGADAQPATPTSTIEMKEVTIRSGETLASIAKREIGRREAWENIVAANPGLDPKKLKAGQKIRVPVKRTAPAKLADKKTLTRENLKNGTNTANDAKAVATASRTHKVKAKETLSALAAKYYKSASSWKRIFDANRDKLASTRDVREGMILNIP